MRSDAAVSRPELVASVTEPGAVEDPSGSRWPSVNYAAAYGMRPHPPLRWRPIAAMTEAAGADVKVVQQMLGHKSGVMRIDLYGHFFGHRLDVVANALDAAMRSAGLYPFVYPGADRRHERLRISLKRCP